MMLSNFQMTFEQFQDLPKLEQKHVVLGTLFIFRVFYDFGLCVIEEVDDKEVSFRIIAKSKRFSLDVDSHQKLSIPRFLKPATPLLGAEAAISEMRLYAES